MAEHEKQLTGSPFVATTPNVTVGPTALTRVKLVAAGGPATVVLYDNTTPAVTDVITLTADVGKPDEYLGAANRKLRFKYGLSIEFQAGSGKLYCYFT